jgi:hypothetical protein
VAVTSEIAATATGRNGREAHQEAAGCHGVTELIEAALTTYRWTGDVAGLRRALEVALRALGSGK